MAPEGKTQLQLEIRLLGFHDAVLVISSDWVREMAVCPAVCSGLSLWRPGRSSTQATIAVTIGLVQGARQGDVLSFCPL